LGSVRQTLTATRGTRATSFDSWGNRQQGLAFPFGFTGEVHDSDAGLVNLRARWYDTRRGTFLTVDPFAGFAEQPYSQHPYQYAYANPVLWTDPSGQVSIVDDGGGAPDDPDAQRRLRCMVRGGLWSAAYRVCLDPAGMPRSVDLTSDDPLQQSGVCPPGTFELPGPDGRLYCHPMIVAQLQLDPALLGREGSQRQSLICLPDPLGRIMLATGAEEEDDQVSAGGPGGGPPTAPPSDIFRRLRELAQGIRREYLSGKEIGKGNVAVARLELGDGTVFERGGTSRARPMDRPLPRSQGGQFEPQWAPESGRTRGEPMDTDPEYKLYSWMADQLEQSGKTHPRGTLYLYTEMSQCTSCRAVQGQWEAKFPDIPVVVVYDMPYTPRSKP
jgi:RHS repeat-associated protein